jgi:hypothetical protein
MRLYELFEHTFPEIKTHNRWKTGKIPDLYNYEDEDDAYVDDKDEPPENNPHVDNPDIKVLGTGAFATAYQHKDTPHDVTKGSKATTTPDGFQALFTALSKDEDAQANPYFPRFRSINKFIGNYNDEGEPRQSYVVKVETLEPYSNLSKAERKMLMNKIFTGHGKDVINHYIEKSHYGEKPGWKLARAVRAALENEEWGDELRWAIRDKKFEEAIEFLQKTAKEYDYTFDLHSSNMMIRRTSVGPQLVINDPMGFSSGSSPNEDGEIEGHPSWE